MSELAHFWEKQDAGFFAQHLDRKAHIRIAYQGECEMEFRSLGPQNEDRRRILLWRVPKDNPHYDPKARPVLKIPFLAFAEESIEDRDDILLPLIHNIMVDAAT